MSIYSSSSSDTGSGFCVLRTGDNVCDCVVSSDKSSTLTKQSSDVVHYISPVSAISPRTVYEGDYYDYQSLLYKKYFPPKEFKTISYASSSTVSCVIDEVQRTLAIVRPHAMIFEDVILRAINESGLSIIHQRHIHLTPEQVSEIYAKYYGSPDFPHMIVSMSVGPILSISLSGVNAVERWKRLIGPEEALRAEWFYPISMRKRFGLRNRIPESIHGSKTPKDGVKENIYFFPNNVVEPIITDEEKVEDYITTYINPTLLNALAELVKVKPQDPIMFLGQCLLLNNPYQPKLPPKIAMLPT